jgi:hypothetical protein
MVKNIQLNCKPATIYFVFLYLPSQTRSPFVESATHKEQVSHNNEANKTSFKPKKSGMQVTILIKIRAFR